MRFAFPIALALLAVPAMAEQPSVLKPDGATIIAPPAPSLADQLDPVIANAANLNSQAVALRTLIHGMDATIKNAVAAGKLKAADVPAEADPDKLDEMVTEAAKLNSQMDKVRSEVLARDAVVKKLQAEELKDATKKTEEPKK